MAANEARQKTNDDSFCETQVTSCVGLFFTLVGCSESGQIPKTILMSLYIQCIETTIIEFEFVLPYTEL